MSNSEEPPTILYEGYLYFGDCKRTINQRLKRVFTGCMRVEIVLHLIDSMHYCKPSFVPGI